MKAVEIQKIAAALLASAENSPVPQETILVCASRAEGRRILSAVTAAGHILVGVRPETPYTLAMELCGPWLCLPGTPRVIEEVEGTEVVRSCLRKTSGLFTGVNAKSLSATRAMYRTFQELAMAGFPDKLKNRPELAGQEKLLELMRLRTTYIRKKQALNLFDRADVFHMAMKAVKKENGETLRRARYVVLGDYAPAFLERQMLELLAGEDRLTVVDLPCAAYMDPDTEKPFLPLGAMAQAEPKREDAEAALKCCEPRFVACRGVETEVRFPFRDILTTKKKLEDCAIVYLSGSYGQPIYEAAARFNIPVTMGGGLPLMGSLLYTTLKKVANLPLTDFYAEEVCKLLTTDGLTPLSRNSLAERLRKKKVGWGKERYLPAVQYEEKSCPDGADKADWKKKQQEQKERMEDWQNFLGLLISVAEPEGDVKTQRETLLRFLTYCNHQSLQEAAAYSKAKELAEHIVGLEDGESALRRLISLMETATYLGGRVEPGKVYCAPLTQAACTGRKYLYVVGFSRYAMQGRRRESPILLDRERQLLNEMMANVQSETDCGFSELKTTVRQGREQEFRVLQLLIRHDGQFILSYPDFESDGMLSLEPAPFFRKVSGGKAERVTYFPEKRSILPVDDFIGRHEIELQKPKAPTANAKWEPAALKDYKARKEQMQEMPFSATMVEEAGRCPYAFYLRRLLNVRSPRPVERHEDVWLDASTIGTFCHTVLEEYYKDPEHCDWKKLFEEEFVKLKETVPMPRPQLEKETREQLTVIVEKAIAWTDDPKNTVGYGRNVLATERWFEGLDMNFTADWTLKMQGSIDRVDELDNGDIAILDYKTGNPDNYKEELHRHWQHYIYTVAEEALHPDHKVTRAGYLFLQDEVELLDLEQEDALRQLSEARIAWVLDQVIDEKWLPEQLPCYEPYADGKKPKKLPEGAMKRARSNGNQLNRCKNWCEFAMICPAQKGVIYDD